MTVNTQNAMVTVRGGLVRRLWNDDCGALLATEWMFIATIMVIGLIPGYVALRQGALDGLFDFSNAVGSLDQSYSFAGQRLECGCWDGHCKDQHWGERDRTRAGVNSSDKAARDSGFSRPVAGRGDHREGYRGRVIAETAGSQFVKPLRAPRQLKATNPTSVDQGVQDSPCN